MYQKLMEATKNSTEVQPALVLALTELFFVAQNVAKVSHSLIIITVTAKEVRLD